MDPAYYSKITLSDVETIFRGDDKEVTIPLVHERVQVLHEAGKVLLDKYQGTSNDDYDNCRPINITVKYLRTFLFDKKRVTNVRHSSAIRDADCEILLYPRYIPNMCQIVQRIGGTVAQPDYQRIQVLSRRSRLRRRER